MKQIRLKDRIILIGHTVIYVIHFDKDPVEMSTIHR